MFQFHSIIVLPVVAWYFHTWKFGQKQLVTLFQSTNQIHSKQSHHSGRNPRRHGEDANIDITFIRTNKDIIVSTIVAKSVMHACWSKVVG
jgi:hypothetical protein